MDPILIRTLANLAVQALRGSAGQVVKARARGKQQRAEDITSRILRTTEASVVPLLNRFQENLSASEMTSVSLLFRSSEYHEIGRMIAVAIATQEYKRSRDDILEIAIALIVLHAGLSREKATVAARLVVDVIARLQVEALGELRKASPSEYGRTIDRAAAEKNAGYLRGLTQRTATIRQQKPDDLPAIAEFLARYQSAIHAKCSDIIPASLDDQRSVPMEAIYVEPTLIPHDPARFGFPGDERSAVRLTVHELLDRSYRTAILGDPGAGKSTLVQRIAYLTSDGQGLPTSSLGKIPFIVTIRRYENAKIHRSVSLSRYIEESIREDFHLDAPSGAIDYVLASGGCLVLFDGLDELLDTHRRNEVTDSIEAFSRLYTSVKVLVTSRSVGYWEAPLNPGTFATVRLSELHREDVHEYAMKWFSLQPNLSPSEQMDVAESFFEESDSIEDLRSNPLMLSLLCNVYRGARSIPQNRADLYERCATMLFERWDEQRGIRGPSVLKADAKAALQAIAYWVFLSDGALDPLPEKKLRAKLTNYWQEEHYESKTEAEQAAISLYRSWQGRAWVLTDVGTTKSGERLYRFTHRTFLEYFTAVEVVRRNPSPARLWRVVGPRIAAGSWDIVSQIAVQVLDEHYRGARRKIYDLISANLVDPRSTPSERLNLLSFATRHIDALNPPPLNCRSLVRVALRAAVQGQPKIKDMPSYENYSLVPGQWVGFGDRVPAGADEEDNEDAEIGPERAMAPLLQLLAASDHLGVVARDELLSALTDEILGVDAELAACTFAFGSAVSRLGAVADAVGIGSDLGEALQSVEPGVLRVLQDSGCVESNLDAWTSITFWAPVVAARTCLVPPARAVAAGMTSSVMCALSPLFHRALEGDVREIVGVLLLRSYMGIDAEPKYSYQSAVEALSALGKGIEPAIYRGPVLDQDWMERSGLEESIVAPYFKAQEGTHAVLAEELAKRTTPVPDNKDAAFGAAILLAMIVEQEKWRIIDESEDQVAFLRLGPLQPLEWVFVSRLRDEFEVDAPEAVANFGLSPERSEYLLRWARREVNLTEEGNVIHWSYR
ncbi:NACHT domain-containing protein [Micromonospora citrea]|uniref:NACHT domain-containing protein n=1 Tax=Micromonospora citrea TaxID=47855 RepID=UPI003C531DA0